VRNTLLASRASFDDEQIALIYDLGRQPIVPSRIENFDWSRGIECPEVTSFTWAKVADVTPLQGADMIATESYWYAQEWLRNKDTIPRPHFHDYVKSSQGNGVLMTRENIVKELAARNRDGTIKEAFRS
jgi:hypothetical protein